MSFISRTLWLVPFALHIGYAAAVFPHFPQTIGRTAARSGTLLDRFYLFWFLVVVAANLAFVLIRKRLPTLNDRMLSVPSKQVWLATAANREVLVARLGGIVETALFGLNIFFIAVFQAIYQANVVKPLIALPMPVLLVGFILFPLLLVCIYFIYVVHGLARLKGAVSPAETTPTDDA